ncbi:MAG TPA: polysaccharide deacetylase family protein, partial [Tessaracoccus flavescens]|nr:polysaccharide deacetylase family protein [Tessaracoccus flavescens]
MPSRDEIVERYAGAAPTQWGLEVDGVVLRSSSDAVALTLDACGGPNGSGIDQELIDFLLAEQIPATLFLNGRWIEANPNATRRLVEQELFCIGNHGTRHVPLSVTGQVAYGIPGTDTVAEVYDEIMGNQETLTELLGAAPTFFRPGTAFFDEVAAQIVRDLGLIPVNFDINADAGATFSAAQMQRATSQATAGSIIIGHFNRPD